jgi:diguanylate cyclase (GGDEF)-like protein
MSTDNSAKKNEKITAEEAESILAETFGGDSVLGLYEKKIMKLRNLLEVSKIINSTLDEDKLLQTILYSFQGQFLISASSIFLLDDFDSSDFVHKVSIGFFDDDQDDIFFSKEDTIIKYFESGQPFLRFETLKNDETLRDLYIKIKHLAPDLIFPIKGKKAIYGLLFIGQKLDGKGFESEDISNIKVFSELASISIENVKLFEMAIKDRMTKLYNHQYFQNILYEEIEKAKKANRELSLIMFDIDHFKMFNDAYGHQQGDIVLKNVSNIIKSSIRSQDFAARYGGEEFAVILPNSGYKEAVKVAEKLRSAIHDTAFPGQAEPLHVTISLGICKFDPKVIQSKTEFIEFTDQALYVSKEQGRNQWNISEFVPVLNPEIPSSSGTKEAGTKAHNQYLANVKKKEEAQK